MEVLSNISFCCGTWELSDACVRSLKVPISNVLRWDVVCEEVPFTSEMNGFGNGSIRLRIFGFFQLANQFVFGLILSYFRFPIMKV